MSGVYSFFLAITAVFCLHACGKTSDNTTQKLDPHASRFPRMQATVETVQGVWESACDVEFADNNDYRKTVYSFGPGGVAFREVQVYGSADCSQNPGWKKTYGGQYRVDRGELKLSWFGVTVTPYSGAWKLNLRQAGDAPYCKAETAFEAGKPQYFTPLSRCNEPSEQTQKLDPRGDGGFARELFVGDVHLYRSQKESL